MQIFRAVVFILTSCASVASQAGTTPVKLRLSHILISVQESEGITHEEAVAAARKKAELVLTKAKAGANFGRLAKQYSADPLTAGNGGSLGWVRRGQFVSSFEDAAFSLKKGQISGIVQTAFGFHILRVNDIAFDRETPVEVAQKELWAQMPPAEMAPAIPDVPRPKWPRPDSLQQAAVGRSTDELRAECARASAQELHPAYPNSPDQTIAYECSILAVSMDDEYERLVDRAVRLQRELCTAGNGRIPESPPAEAQLASDWNESQATGTEWKKRWDEVNQNLTKAELAEAKEREAESAELRQQVPNWDKGNLSQQEQLIVQRIFNAHKGKTADLQKVTQGAKAKALRGLLDFGRVYSNCGHGW